MRLQRLLLAVGLVAGIDADAIRFQGKDMVEVIRFLEFVTNDEPGLWP